MIDFILVKYVHFVGIFVVVGALCAEGLMIRGTMTRNELSFLSRVDMFYGLSTIVVLTAGFVMWFMVGKPASFYSGNWIFITKLVLFGIIGLLSIIPTVFFIKNRKGPGEEQVEIPSKIRNMIYFELVLLLILPLCAVLMANGVGSF